jgi:hypothetical protein
MKRSIMNIFDLEGRWRVYFLNEPAAAQTRRAAVRYATRRRVSDHMVDSSPATQRHPSVA